MASQLFKSFLGGEKTHDNVVRIPQEVHEHEYVVIPQPLLNAYNKVTEITPIQSQEQQKNS